MTNSSLAAVLLDWFSAHGQPLPWRATYDPYHVWISEIMAQQTQMSRVVSYFQQWMELFPSIADVATANEDDILKAWEGLGYYSRARNILKTAQIICKEYNGRFPSGVTEIRALPGIGKYTAGAIASIAFNHDEPCIDANVKRVFSRVYDLEHSLASKEMDNAVERRVLQCMPSGNARNFNQAIMEFGQRICAKSPRCTECPLTEFCMAYKNGTTSLRPVLKPRSKPLELVLATGFLLHEGTVLIQKRLADDVWPGLWEFPGGGVEEGETPEQAVVREYLEEVALPILVVEKIGVVHFSYTKYRVTLHGFLCHLLLEHGQPVEPVFHEAQEGAFVAPSSLVNYAFPSGHRKLIQLMRRDIRFSSLF